MAEREGAVLGWLSFQWFYSRPAYAATVEVSVYVSRAAQRGGIGRLLLARAIERAPDLGVSTLVAFVLGHNAASLALFERFGFERRGRLPRVATKRSWHRALGECVRMPQDRDMGGPGGASLSSAAGPCEAAHAAVSDRTSP